MVSLCHSSDNNLKKDYLSIKPMLERIVLSFRIGSSDTCEDFEAVCY